MSLSLNCCVCYSVLIVVIIIIGTLSQEVLQFPQNVTVLPGENGTFHCNSNTPTTKWQVVFFNGSKKMLDTMRVIEDQSFLDLLAEQNIFLSGMQIAEHYNYTMKITASTSRNLSQIQCAVAQPIDDGSEFINSPSAFLRVIGPPTSVKGLQSSLFGSSVFLSWSPSFSPFSVPVWYNVTVEDADTGELLHLDSTHINSINYSPQEGFCSILQFIVHASNRAGETDGSVHNSSLLTKPSIDMVISSLHHEISLVDGAIMVAIEFDTLPGCISYPVVYYKLVLDEIAPSQNSTVIGPSTSPRFVLNTSYVRENARYRYQVQAVNTLNLSDATEPRELMLTDVLMPTVIVTATSVCIRCNFIPGSLSKGCYLKLVVNDVPQIHGIERRNGTSVAEGVVELPDGIDSGVDIAIMVFDWEQDGSMGKLSVDVVDVMDRKETMVTSSTEGLNPESDNFQHLTLIIAMSTSVLIVALLIPIITVSCCVVYKCCLKSQKEQAPVSNKVLCNTVDYSLPMHGPMPYEVYPAAPQRSSGVGTLEGNRTSRPTLSREVYSQLDYLCTDCGDGRCLYSQLNHSMSSLPSGSAIVMNPLSSHHLTNCPNSLGLSRSLRSYSQHSELQPRDYSLLEITRNRSSSHSPRPLFPCSPPDYSEIDTLHGRVSSLEQSTVTTV